MLTIDIFGFFLAEELGNVGANGPCSIRRQAMLAYRFSLALGAWRFPIEARHGAAKSERCDRRRGKGSQRDGAAQHPYLGGSIASRTPGVMGVVAL
jgi:hypothetical protein